MPLVPGGNARLVDTFGGAGDTIRTLRLESLVLTIAVIKRSVAVTALLMAMPFVAKALLAPPMAYLSWFAEFWGCPFSQPWYAEATLIVTVAVVLPPALLAVTM